MKYNVFLLNRKTNMKYWICLLSVLFFSCKNHTNNNDSVEYFSNGNFKKKVFINNKGKTTLNYFEHHKDLVKSIVREKDSTSHIIEYYPNNKKKRLGNYAKENLKIGKWSFFDKEGNLNDIHEYLIVDGKSYLNQRWSLGFKGDTIGGNFFELNYKDTVNKKEANRFHFFLSMPLLSNESESFIVLPKEEGEIKSDFSNRNEILWDTIFSIGTKYPKDKKLKDRNYDIVLDVFSDDVGSTNLKGILIEKNKSKSDSADFVTRELFFDIKYYVK